MTMTSSAVPGVGLVCPEAADEANPSMAPSPTSRAHVNWVGLLVACDSSLARLAFLFCCVCSVVLGCMGSAMKEVAPRWMVGSKVLPGLSVYGEIYQTLRLSLNRLRWPPTKRLPWQSSP